ncbi:sensor histidine kinase [Clostridium sp. PL3]|uniref:Sensor histidine kinase n=1 Tax=Clostridium thailandense TaxID=2794346 RepID=A0A949TUX1_9CLOT|nr:sensor histidine kinase [Clostridium thailandense]MBV7273941.1 sensor histidine kinase [Clostridium thailandense]
MLKLFLYKLNFFVNIKIKNKIIVSFFLLIICTICTISAFVINEYRNSLETYTTVYSNQVVDQVIKSVDFYVNEMQSISPIANYNYNIQRYLKTVQPDNQLDVTMDFNNLVNFLTEIESLRRDVVSIFLIANNGSAVSDKYSINIDKNYNFTKQQWYKDAFQHDDKSIIVSPHSQSYVINSDKSVVSLSKAVKSYSKDEIIGVLLVDLNLDALEDICKNAKLGKDGYVFIVDKNGNIVYHPDYSYISKSDDTLISDVLKSAEGNFIRSINSEKQQVTFKRYEPANWTVVSVTPYSEIVQQINNMKTFMFLICFVCLLCAFLLSIFIASMITKPLKKLAHFMKKAEKGNLDISLDFKGNDEIGMLGQRFNTMINEIRILMEQVVKEQEEKRKLEFKMLQAQINPHFLYNTLDSIIWMAEVNNENVVLMVDALAKLFRISLSGGQEMITVEREIEHIRNYLIIQSMRYTNKFEYEINADESILNNTTLKLILQPLVENAIYHGIKAKRQKGLIIINAKKIDNNILYEIIDDGAGMDKTKCEEILKYNPSNNINKSHNGVGLKNVNERIKLYYGENYGLKIASEPGKGTTVQILIPISFNIMNINDI